MESRCNASIRCICSCAANMCDIRSKIAYQPQFHLYILSGIHFDYLPYFELSELYYQSTVDLT